MQSVKHLITFNTWSHLTSKNITASSSFFLEDNMFIKNLTGIIAKIRRPLWVWIPHCRCHIRPLCYLYLLSHACSRTKCWYSRAPLLLWCRSCVFLRFKYSFLSSSIVVLVPADLTGKVIITAFVSWLKFARVRSSSSHPCIPLT